MMKRYLLCIGIVVFSLIPAFVAGAQPPAKTPKELEAMWHLQRGLVVFLTFHDFADPNIDKIRTDIGSVAANFKDSIESVYVSGNNKKEDKLRVKFKILPKETAVFIIIPTGRVVAKIEGKDITKTNLMRVLVSFCGGGGCGAGGCGPK